MRPRRQQKWLCCAPPAALHGEGHMHAPDAPGHGSSRSQDLGCRRQRIRRRGRCTHETISTSAVSNFCEQVLWVALFLRCARKSAALQIPASFHKLVQSPVQRPTRVLRWSSCAFVILSIIGTWGCHAQHFAGDFPLPHRTLWGLQEHNRTDTRCVSPQLLPPTIVQKRVCYAPLCTQEGGRRHGCSPVP